MKVAARELSQQDMAALPEPILNVLHRVIRRRRRVILVRGVLAVITVAIVALLSVMAVDVLLTLLSPVARWLVSGTAVVIIVGALAWFLARPLMRPMSVTRVAQIVDAHHPEFEERVSSAVELLLSRSGRFGETSPVLLGELTRQAVERVRAVEPHREFHLRAALPYLAIASAVALVFGSLWVFWPRQTLRLVVRAVAPNVETDNLGADSLRVQPGKDTTIAIGDPLRIEVTALWDRVQTANVLRQEEGGVESTQPLSRMTQSESGRSTFGITIPRVDKEFRYRLLVDNALTRYYQVRVTPRPEVSSFDVRYEYPAYTGLAIRTERDARGDIVAPVGTTVTLTAAFNKPLVEAGLLVAGLAIESGKSKDAQHGTWQIKLDPKIAGEWHVVLKDQYGLVSQTAPRRIRALADMAPQVVIAEPSLAEIRRRPNDLVPISYRVREDYGVSAVSLMVRFAPGRIASIACSLPGRSTIEQGTWVGRTVLDLRSLRISGVPRIQVEVQASDTLPAALGGPQVGHSKPLAIVFDAGAASDAAQWAEANALRITASINQAIALLNDAKGQLTAARPQLEKDSFRLSDPVRHFLDVARTKSTQAEEVLWKLSESDVAPEFSRLVTQAGQVAKEHVGPARAALEIIPVAENKPEQIAQAKLAGDEITAAIAALKKILEAVKSEQDEAARARALAAKAEQLAEEQSRIRNTTQQAMDEPTKEDTARLIAERILETQRQIAAQAAELAQQVDASGFKAGTEHRQAADFARQTADHLQENRFDPAIASGKQSAKALDDIAKKLKQTPPPKAPQDPLDPPLADTASQLAQRQKRVNEQLDALKKGDLAKAIASMEQDLAEQTKQLADRTEKLSKLAEQGGNPQKGKDVAGAKDDLASAADKAMMAAAELGHIDNIPKISPPKFVEGPQSPSDHGGNPNGGQGTMGGGSNTGAGSSKSPSPSNNNQNQTIGKGKNLGKATLTADALLHPKPPTNSGPSGGSGTELQADAEELLRKGLAQIIADNNPLAKGFGGYGGGPSDEPVPPTPPKEFSAQSDSQDSQSQGSPSQQGGPSNGRPGGDKPARSGGRLGAGPGNVAARLGAMGISGDDWLRLPSELRTEILNAADDRAPTEYRDLVKRYFQTMARRGSLQAQAK